MARGTLKLIGEGLSGAALIAAALTTPFLRSWRTTWGATSDEVSRTLPGDDLVPHPKWQWTHAVTIRAPAAAIWPWLVQMGQGRGGLYSYELLENMVGCRIHNADRIIPELANLQVGDEILLHPKSPGLPVAIVEPGRALVLHAGAWSPAEAPSESAAEGHAGYSTVTWMWFLEPIDETSTRLISRYRTDYGPGLANRLGYGTVITEPVGFAMSRKMLLGIKRRAEAAARHESQP
jgi:hypothetical protein